MENLLQFNHAALDLFIIEKIKEEVQKALQNFTPNNVNPLPESGEYISRIEARKVLGGISNPTIIEWGKQGIITCYRINHSVRYKKDELLASFKKIQLHKMKS